MARKISIILLMIYLSAELNDLPSDGRSSLFSAVSIMSCNATQADQSDADKIAEDSPPEGPELGNRNTGDQQNEETEKREKSKDECINIESLKIKGNRSFSTVRLKLRMKSWHSSLLPGNMNCYNEEWLKKDIKKLIEFYRKKGFADVKIEYYLNRSTKGGLIIELSIEEGFRYEFLFNGNHFFSDRELTKKIDLVKKGNLNDAALSRAKVDMKNLYIEAGFEDVKVDFHKEGEKETISSGKDGEIQAESSSESSCGKSDCGICYVEFAINEGRRSVVNQLKILGNEQLSGDEIMNAMLTRQRGALERGGYNSKVVDKDIGSIELLYLSKGFLNASVSKKITLHDAPIDKPSSTTKAPDRIDKLPSVTEAEDSDKPVEALPPVRLADIEINIREGSQTTVQSARITGLEQNRDAMGSKRESVEPISESEALEIISLRPGEPFREYMVRSDENALSMMISELGYPHVKVISSVTFSVDRSKADVVWHVQKGQFTRFGNIHYSGNRRLKREVIEKRVEIEPGAPFSLRKVFTTEKNIRESSAVKYVQVKSQGLARMEKAPDIEVDIEENKPYFAEAALGYDTEQNLYIDTKVGDNNFLGQEIDGWIAASISGIGHRVESGLKKPFFLGTEINATANIYIEDQEELNKNFGTESWGYSSGFSRYLFIKKLIAGLNLTYENRTTYGDIDDIDPEEQEPRNILITSFALVYDSRDSSVRPSKGLFSSGSADLYTGFDNDLDRFLKYQIDLRKYISPFNKITFALRTRMGYIKPLGSEDSVAQDQLFFLGGTPNVRGFKENMLEYDESGDPVGGLTSVNSTIEARVDLPADFELNCFVDTGRVDDLANSIESRGFRSSVGAGLRYITPIGPVGLLYGHKLETEDGESPGRVHFSVGYTF